MEQTLSFVDQAQEHDRKIEEVEWDIIRTKAALAQMSEDDDDVF